MNIRGFSVAIILLTANCSRSVAAETDVCAECGACAACRNVCRLVCEETKVDVVCYGCQCEDFCVSGPSCPNCEHCETVCAPCDADGECRPDKVRSEPKEFRWTSWLPGQAKLYTRKKLMKKTVTKTVPTYRWVVEPVCATCCEARRQEKVEAKSMNRPTPPSEADAPLLRQHPVVLPCDLSERTSD